MQTTVNLQEPFSYSLIPIVIISILIITLLVIGIIYAIRKVRIQNKEEIIVKKDNIKEISKIKEKYINKLISIEKSLTDSKISTRRAYQETSSVIRFFVYEMTGIKVQNYTLQDIKELNMKSLYELVEEYYVPEFAEKSVGDIKSSIEKTRKVIERWN